MKGDIAAIRLWLTVLPPDWLDKDELLGKWQFEDFYENQEKTKPPEAI